MSGSIRPHPAAPGPAPALCPMPRVATPAAATVISGVANDAT
jgi:hypothetical protein